MQLTLDQVAEMAPDASSASAGKKLMSAKNWDQLGRSPQALWGLCRGSAVYQVKVDLSNLGYKCSCPSRKFPCKHVLGLLMLWAGSPETVAEGVTPEWVEQWLATREQKESRRVEKQDAADAPKKQVDEKAQQRRAAQRDQRVTDGLATLDIWICDLVRNGLATVETKPASFWEEQAKRLVDAQAPGLSSKVARLANLPQTTIDWPDRLLAELGRLKLLIHAWNRINELGPNLQAEIRQLLGFTVSQEELERDGEKVDDTWVVIGQWVDDEDHVRAQRSWLVGRESLRTALVLQFSAAGQPFAEQIIAGSEQRGKVVFYPGAGRQRARFISREGAVNTLTDRPPGAATIEEFLRTVAQSLSRSPWLTSFPAVLHDVTITLDGNKWFLRDREGQSIALFGADHWKLLAMSGGQPIDLIGEWDGFALRPLGLLMEGSWRAA